MIRRARSAVSLIRRTAIRSLDIYFQPATPLAQRPTAYWAATAFLLAICTTTAPVFSQAPPPPAEPPASAESLEQLPPPTPSEELDPRDTDDPPRRTVRPQAPGRAGNEADAIRPRLSERPRWRIESEAYLGEPFGVGRVTLRWSDDAKPSELWEQLSQGQGFLIREASGRIHYPVFVEQQSPLGANLPPVDAAPADGPLLPRGENGRGLRRGRLLGDRRVRGRGLQLLAQLIAGGPRELTCYFLLTGREPLRLSLLVPDEEPVDVLVESRPHAHQRLMSEWWDRYTADYTEARRDGSYPVIAETYLCGMLAQRLRLRAPFAAPRSPEDQLPKQVLELLAGTENLRLTRLAESWAPRAQERADLEPPHPLTWQPSQRVATEAEVQADPLAAVVPADCFYVRFGRFNNYLWLKEFLSQQGGDVARLVTLRGHQRSFDASIQNQLGSQETALSRWLGETAIDDMALIGADFYVQEGAALGVLFQARQNQILRSQLQQQRQKRWQELPVGERLQETIAHRGAKIDYLGSRNHQLRSYYVQVGDFHLVTNSLTLARDTISAHAGDNRLIDDEDYQRASSREAGRSDLLAFVFLPQQFFARLLSPQYQIEVGRRVDAAVQLQMLQMAGWAAQSEGIPDESLSTWVARGLLPRHFLQARRVEDDAPAWDRVDDQWQHRLRGAHGSFVPVPDVPLERVTPSEANRYAALRRYAEEHWRRLDPITIRVARPPSRNPAGDHSDTLVIEARLNPFDPQKYGTMTSILGRPTSRWIATSSNDIISVQAHMQGGYLSPTIGPHHLFLGVEDLEPRKVTAERPLFRWLQIIRSTPGYLGAWPKSGLLDLIPLGFSRTANQLGLARLPLGIWRWQTPEGFAVLSFFPDILEKIVPELTVVEANPEWTAERYGDAEPAQLRVYVGNLAASKFGAWVDDLSYERASQSSWANIQLMHLLVQQFDLPLEEGRSAAEQLLGARLVCPLGGELSVLDIAAVDSSAPATVDRPAGSSQRSLAASARWTSTALQRADEGEEGFRSPLMAWFRGLRGHLTMAEGELVTSWVLQIHHETAAAGLTLPQLPGIPNWFPSRRPAAADSAMPPAPADEELPAPDRNP